MKVETYEVLSVDEQHGNVINEEVSEEAMALIESLDLDGQRELLEEKKVSGETVTVRFPYRRMTAEEMAVYGALMPLRRSLAQYCDGPIPLRALQVAAHAREMFDSIEVWCPEPGRDDPLLVGVKGGSAQTWSATRMGGERFILARWGDVLEDFEVLRKKAHTIVSAKLRAQVAKARATVAMYEHTINEKVDEYLLTGKSDSEYVSFSLTA